VKRRRRRRKNGYK